MESFLEFVNFCEYIIKNFSHIVKPLNELKDKKEWELKEEYKKVFEELKYKITSQLVFALPIRKGRFRVETNALGHAIERILFQEQE